jgi:hypothetical protein
MVSQASILKQQAKLPLACHSLNLIMLFGCPAVRFEVLAVAVRGTPKVRPRGGVFA